MLTHRLIVALVALAPSALASEPLRVPEQYPTIQAAITAARPGDVVIVADGIYLGAGNRDLDFGGKDITLRSASGPSRCIIDCQASAQDPHRGFLFENGETRAALLQGFTIQNAATQEGAIADQFNGAGIRIRGGASPTIVDCVFRHNTAGCWGGGVYVGFAGDPLFDRCMFESNTADDGGGFFAWMGGSAEIANSVFLGNNALATGGAIAQFGLSGGRLEIRGCTIVQNSSRGVGGVLDNGIGSTITSSIIWGNGGFPELYSSTGSSVTYCCVEGGYQGIGNTGADPMLRPDGYHLRLISPCRNAGDPSALLLGELDIDGQRRVVQGRVDIGADELAGDIPAPSFDPRG